MLKSMGIDSSLRWDDDMWTNLPLLVSAHAVNIAPFSLAPAPSDCGCIGYVRCDRAVPNVTTSVTHLLSLAGCREVVASAAPIALERR
jgi:hypothetical protein